LDRIIHKQSVNCKYCGSTNIVKYGTFHGMQRYFCKNCRRKFADNDALPKMKTPVWIISLSLNCYYHGMPLAAIQKEINQRHGAYYAQSTIYNWIMRFSEEAVNRSASMPAVSGDTWFLPVTPITAGARQFYFIDIFDIKTKFLITSRLAGTFTADEIVILIHSAFSGTKVNTNQPVTIMVPPVFAAAALEFTTSGTHPGANYIVAKADSALVKEFGSLLKKRAKVVRNFKNIKTARIITESWRIHYNYFVDHAKPNRYSAAECTGLSLFRNWEDIICRSVKNTPE
jgi:putative transposase